MDRNGLTDELKLVTGKSLLHWSVLLDQEEITACTQLLRPKTLAITGKQWSNIGYRGQIGEEPNEVCQFGVERVVEPRSDWDGVIGIEEIRGGRIVENDARVQRTSEHRQVLGSLLASVKELYTVPTDLDIVSSVIIATFSEQSMCDCLVHVNLVENWIGVLERCEL
jgi:hypothetical protein